MNIPIRLAFYSIIVACSMACSSKVTPTSNYPKKNTPYVPSDYDEDLSSVRPRYDAPPMAVVNTVPEKRTEKEKPVPQRDLSLAVNSKVDAVLDTIANQNKSVKFAQGYRIQVYVGNNRQDVDNAKVYIMQNFPELNNYMAYNQPTYKLKAGDFMYRMDAERYFGNIKTQFSGATIVADRIDIRKSLLAK